MTAPPRRTLVVFLGGQGPGHAEQIVATARWAASLDSIDTALSTGAYTRAILVTDGQAQQPDNPAVTVDADAGPYHFGRRLAGVIRQHGLRSVVYMGGGSLPLLSTEEFGAIALAAGEGRGVTNNAYSSDLVAFSVSERVLDVIAGVDRDNSLSRALAEQAGLQVEPLGRTPSTQMDIDSPTDLAVLSLTGQGGTRLRAYLGALGLDPSPYQRVLPLFTDTRAQIVVAGRVGSQAWQYLERETACRVRLFAEERGMEAEGRAADGTARSLLGFFLASAGRERFFAALAELGDAAFIDTRVLLAHNRLETSAEDRFLSDLGRWREIGEPFLRDFTRAAAEARIPVLLGGHSLMSGGLMALNEHAWGLRDEEQADR